ncbi:class F sortase [Micrococcus sp.]|uniref:class F sortase n=1 Tax=Micrococcus sp. TaxID=1271 RepID=UPI002A91F540|nr:class F sortase [Micrococcus sp.]MDY6054618.1 class F sortase [Micrococcus sp.]
MRRPLTRALWAVLAVLCLVAVWLGVRGGLALGEAPVTPAPVAASAPSTPMPSDAGAPPSATPSASGAGTVGSAPSSASASEAAPPTGLLTGPAAPQESITAVPVHVSLTHAGEQIVGAPIVPAQTDGTGELNPQPQTVGWYGPPQWPTTPGERSRHPGILAGHVIHSGRKDVFWNLERAEAGDLVVITYDDGTQAAFRVDQNAQTVEKQAFTHDQAHRWAWELDAPERKVTLITCELEPGSGMTGLSYSNWVVQATRVQ